MISKECQCDDQVQYRNYGYMARIRDSQEIIQSQHVMGNIQLSGNLQNRRREHLSDGRQRLDRSLLQGNYDGLERGNLNSNLMVS